MQEPRFVIAQAGIEIPEFIDKIFFKLSSHAVQSYTPSTTDPRLFFLDIAEFQTIDFAKTALFNNPKVEGFNIRIGGSASVKDKNFAVHWAGAKDYEFKRSIYTYNWPGWTVDQHIRNFIDSVNLYCDSDLGEGPIWVDVECHAEKSRREVSNHAFQYIQALRRETGKVVGWYTGKWFIDGYMEVQDWMLDTLAWLAQWISNQEKEHPGPLTPVSAIKASSIVMHQTGSRCKEELFGGTGYVDTDRVVATTAKYNELYSVETPPLPPPVNGDIEERLNYLEVNFSLIQQQLNNFGLTLDDVIKWAKEDTSYKGN